MITSQADINATNADGTTALHAAAHSGRVDCVALLLQLGARVDAQDKWADTPLHKAVVNGHTACAEVLLAHGALVNQVVRLITLCAVG